MNKRCTESSCRRTFSTLNFDGVCPYCGKRYPQLKCARKSGDPILNNGDIAVLRVAGKEKDFIVRADLTAVRLFALLGEKIKAIKMFREEIMNHGFSVGLKDGKTFCEGIANGGKLLTSWALTDEVRDGRRVIVPVKTKVKPSERKRTKRAAPAKKTGGSGAGVIIHLPETDLPGKAPPYPDIRHEAPEPDDWDPEEDFDLASFVEDPVFLDDL